MTESDLAGFENFWKVYPRKIKKIDAKKAWCQMKKDRPPTQEIVKAVLAQRKCKDWKKDNGKYIPHPGTWLRAGQWDDVLDYEVKRKVECYVCRSSNIIGDWMGKPYCPNPSCKQQIRGY